MESNPPSPPSICLLTPSYIGDLEQFAILRRSINVFAPGLPHLAIVHTEGGILASHCTLILGRSAS